MVNIILNIILVIGDIELIFLVCDMIMFIPPYTQNNAYWLSIFFTIKFESRTSKKPTND